MVLFVEFQHISHYIMEQSSSSSKLHLILHDENDRFLGVGGTGCVFRVSSDQGGTRAGLALKVVVGKRNIAQLEGEFSRNQMVAKRAGDVIVKATILYATERKVSAGLLFDEVGRELESTDDNLKRGLEALLSLHQHGFHHGDARLANLLICFRNVKFNDSSTIFR